MALEGMKKALGENISRMLREKGLKQVDLANAVCQSEPYISKICSGRHLPRNSLEGIAQFLGVRPWELLKGPGE